MGVAITYSIYTTRSAALHRLYTTTPFGIIICQPRERGFYTSAPARLPRKVICHMQSSGAA